MKHKLFLRPLMMCASALALTACSYQSANDLPPVAANQARPLAQNTSGLKAIADDLAKNGQHEAAIPLYRHLGAKTGDPAVLTALASSLLARGAHTEAVKVLSALGIRGQLGGKSWYTLGKANLALGQFDDALQAFDQASRFTPNDDKTMSGRGIALAALGRTNEAMDAFGASMDPLTISNRALVLATTGRANVAVFILEPLVKSGVLGPQGRQNLAMAYLLDGRETEAYNLARLDLDPGNIGETFTFYRTLGSLAPAERMQALVTGTIDPSWTRDEAANLQIADSGTRREATKRLMDKPVMVAETSKPTPKPEPVQKPQPQTSRADYVLKEVPPLVEPEGYALQIGAYRTIDNLMRGWTILYRKSGDILKDIPPRRSEVNFGKAEKGPRGFYYRLNAGPLNSFDEANMLCKELRARGTSCWIRPPEKTEGTLPESTNAHKDKANERQIASLSK